MDKILGVINLHNKCDFGVLTQRNNMANVSFLGRYHFIDLALSRFTNCKINSIEILVKDKPTLLFKHLSTGAKSWSINTKLGGINLMYNELESKKSYMNTDFNTLLVNKNILHNYNHAFVLFAPCEILCNIDYQKMMEAHILSGKSITIAYKNCSDEMDMYKDVDKVVVDPESKNMKYFKNDATNPNVYMNTFIIHRSKLIEILENFDIDDEIPTLNDIISYAARLNDVSTYEYTGFMRYFRNLENYMQYSLEMLKPENYNQVFDANNPLFTRGYDTVPTIYGKNSDIQSCYVTSGCKIDGKISNSIIGRKVIIEKGATISNSIILTGAHIKAGCVIEDAIIANNTVVEAKTKIKGNIKKPAFIQA